ncbi:uncharacterized [Tachysurus ichikawai]
MIREHLVLCAESLKDVSVTYDTSEGWLKTSSDGSIVMIEQKSRSGFVIKAAIEYTGFAANLETWVSASSTSPQCLYIHHMDAVRTSLAVLCD